MPTHPGRIRRSLSSSTVNECVQPIRCSINVTGIRGYSTSNVRTCASTPSADVGCCARSYVRRHLLEVIGMSTSHFREEF
jgi:hypothetical protein